MTSLALLALLSSSVTAVTHVPISLATKSFTPVRETTPSFNNNTFRDGGVSTYVNGLHLQLFADSMTCKTANISDKCALGWNETNTSSAVRNSLAYFGYVDPKDPSNLYTIGGTGTPPKMHFQSLYGTEGLNGPGYFPLAPGEDVQVTGVWPDQVITLPGNKTALVDAAIVSSGQPKGYNALFVVDVVPPSEIPTDGSLNITRVPLESGLGLFYDGEVRYCDQGMTLDIQQDQIFCFGQSKSGIKMASVPIDQYGNRSAYQFFNASTGTYSPTIPSYYDNSSDIITAPSFNTANFYYSYYHQTYVCILHTGLAGVYVSYSTNGKLSGQWTPLAHLIDLAGDPGCTLYGAPNKTNTLPYTVAAHPAWYGPGSNKLLISWSSCGHYVDQATIVFA